MKLKNLITAHACCREGVLVVNGKAVAGTVPPNRRVLRDLILHSDSLRRWLITAPDAMESMRWLKPI